MDITRLFLLDESDNFLVVFRTYTSGKWAGQTFALLPGGKVDPGETGSAGVVRETLEEIGVTVERATYVDTVDIAPGRVFGFYVSRQRDGEWSGVPELREPEKFSAMAWCPPSAAAFRMLCEVHGATMGDALQYMVDRFASNKF